MLFVASHDIALLNTLIKSHACCQLWPEAVCHLGVHALQQDNGHL